MRERNRYLILFGIIVLGFILRAYHLNYPPIGYHNVKENEYLSQAVFMIQDNDYLHRKLFRQGMEEVPLFEEYSQMPILSWLFVVLWKVFGMHFWIARLPIVIFSLGSILAFYFLVKRLTKDEPLALLSACLLAIMPLAVFFGRNIQPETPALFFLLLENLQSGHSAHCSTAFFFSMSSPVFGRFEVIIS